MQSKNSKLSISSSEELEIPDNHDELFDEMRDEKTIDELINFI